jgi:YD repeat-containing protein
VDAGPPIQYGYDEAGRLVAVYDADGNSARYVYDEAGNLLEIARFTASELTIHEFSPNAGPVGSTVTLTGSGFREVVAENAVAFNGVPAQVVAATRQRLVLVVPDGATTGRISVTVNGVSVTSRDDFTVGQQGPTISGFTPNKGSVGTAITIDGTGFETSSANNAVSVGGVGARVSAGSTTQLTAVAPQGGTGKVRVSTPSGTAVSTEDFFLVPSGYDPANVEVTSRIAIDGAPITVSLSQGTKTGLLLFDATKGDRVGLAATGVDLGGGGSAQLQIFDTAGTLFWSTTFSGNTTFNLPVIPRTTTYTLAIKPGSNATRLAVTVMLSRELTGTLTADGTAVTYATNRPGQDGRYTFTATAGANLSLMFTGSTFPGSNLYATVYNLSGGAIQNFWVSTSGTTVVDLKNLVAGTYSVYLDPSGAITGQATLRLNTDATGSIEVDGPATDVSLVSGQNGRYTFSGTAGEYLGLGVTGFTTAPASQNVSFQVLKPDGTSLISCGFSASNSCNLPVLPTTGTYTLFVDPSGGASATLQVLVSRAVQGSLVADGTATTFATSRVGQDGRYTFTATAGANFSLVFTGSTFPSSNLYATIYNPSGSYVQASWVSTSGTTVLDLKNLVAGTYSVYLDPSGAITGQATLRLNADATGSITVDGPATDVSLVSGQNGRYTFSGTAGEYLGLGVTGFTTAPASQNVSFQVLKPDGTSLTSCGFSASNSCNLPVLPTTGTYTLFVDPSGGASATLQVLLSHRVQGSLVADSSTTTFATSRVGQDGRYTFTATAASSVTLTFSGRTFSDVYARIYNPSGSVVWQTWVASTSSTASLTNLVAGTYVVELDPYQAATGQVSMTLK